MTREKVITDQAGGPEYVGRQAEERSLSCIEEMGGIKGHLEGMMSCLEELGLLVREARAATPARRREENLAARVAEMVETVRSMSEDLRVYRRVTDKLPCLECGSPFLPRGRERPTCPRCGAEHWLCPDCGQDNTGDAGCVAGCGRT